MVKLILLLICLKCCIILIVFQAAEYIHSKSEAIHIASLKKSKEKPFQENGLNWKIEN